MKNLEKMNWTIHRSVCAVALAALLFALCTPEVHGGSKKQEDIYDLTLDDNLGTPEINNDKRAKKIEKYQYDVAGNDTIITSSSRIISKTLMWR